MFLLDVLDLRIRVTVFRDDRLYYHYRLKLSTYCEELLAMDRLKDDITASTSRNRPLLQYSMRSHNNIENNIEKNISL